MTIPFKLLGRVKSATYLLFGENLDNAVIEGGNAEITIVTVIDEGGATEMQIDFILDEGGK